MSKNRAKTEAPKASAPAAPQQILQVKSGVKYRGARAAWYERLSQFNGKPLADFLANVEADRPSVYGSKSKHAGKPEPVAGWYRFFVRTGVATTSPAK